MQSRKMITMVAVVALATGASLADTIKLSGTIRDFTEAHPDMQNDNKSIGLRTGLVESLLGEDDKPVLNLDTDYERGMITSRESFDQWYRDVPGVNISIPYTITLDNGSDEPGGVYTFAVERPKYFFPIDGKGFNDTAVDANGDKRNFYFTYEIHTQFTYTDPAERSEAMQFSFTGDDDVWVFINGKLAVDIGGVHGQQHGSVNLDEEAEKLGLESGGSYKLDFFFAERYTSQSNFRIETTIQFDEEPQPTTISPLYD